MTLSKIGQKRMDITRIRERRKISIILALKQVSNCAIFSAIPPWKNYKKLTRTTDHSPGARTRQNFFVRHVQNRSYSYHRRGPKPRLRQDRRKNTPGNTFVQTAIATIERLSHLRCKARCGTVHRYGCHGLLP